VGFDGEYHPVPGTGETFRRRHRHRLKLLEIAVLTFYNHGMHRRPAAAQDNLVPLRRLKCGSEDGSDRARADDGYPGHRDSRAEHTKFTVVLLLILTES